MTDNMTAAAPPKPAENTSREELQLLISNIEEQLALQRISGSWNLLKRAIPFLRLAAKPADDGVRERIITTCANIANRYRPNSTARDIEREICALHQSPNTGDGK